MDISMCTQYECENRKTCLRYTAKPSEWQAFSSFNPTDCHDYLEAPYIKDVEELDERYKSWNI